MSKNEFGAQPATVSGLAEVSGGLNAGNFVDTDIDAELFRFNSDDTPLMNMMLSAKRVNVTSPEVDHYMIDEPKSSFRTSAAVMDVAAPQFVLPLEGADQNLAREYSTLLVKDTDGYSPDGMLRTPGRSLMLFVVGHDPTTNNPICRAVNGYKKNPEEEFTICPNIPKNALVVMLANSLYETQKEVDPDLIVPQPTRIYLQKRGMNQVVSDYFDSQKKRIPFSKAIVAEQAIANFKVRGNRTLWAGRAGKFKMNIPKMGMQYVYTTEGLRWQFKRELQHSGAWTVEKVIAMAKMFFTGEDVPKTAILLAGKNLLEQLQCIDYSRHPEIQITTKTNSIGWSVTNFHTVFGDIEIKREPTLDRLGWSNSGALIGEGRLVHYVYSTEHSFSDRVEGEEATRSGILIWDAVALKGGCHIWIDGEGTDQSAQAVRFQLWDEDKAPEKNITPEGMVFYLLRPATGFGSHGNVGDCWVLQDNKWVEYIPNA